jgi:tetratricopeptide (TPR) repeat protein
VKAAPDSSYHGGSRRGGYGHGLAADIVSVKGETRAERFAWSEILWKWVDAHEKELGIGRPYLDKDPPHVAPIDGKEYADKRGAANARLAGLKKPEAIRLDPKSALAFSDRGVAYANKADYNRALVDFNEAIRLDPKSVHAFRNRGVLYVLKGDYGRALADFNKAIRLDPKSALAFCNRGRAKQNINDASGNADIAIARQLDPSVCR